MKISDLISQLESIARVHGDIPVATRDSQDIASEYIRIASSLSIEDGIIDTVVVIL